MPNKPTHLKWVDPIDLHVPSLCSLVAAVLEVEDALNAIQSAVDAKQTNDLQQLADAVKTKLAHLQSTYFLSFPPSAFMASVADNNAAVDAYNALEGVPAFVEAANSGDRATTKQARDALLAPLSTVRPPHPPLSFHSLTNQLKAVLAPAVDRAPTTALHRAVSALNSATYPPPQSHRLLVDSQTW